MNQVSETLQKMGNAAPRLYVIATGAGAGIQDTIWRVPGISNFFIGAEMSYAPEKTEKALGFVPTKFVSVETAVDLALAAYMEGWKPGHRAIGLGLTASVCSTRPRKGEHQIIVAVFTENACYTIVEPLEKGDFWNNDKLTPEQLTECIRRQREDDGEVANNLGLYLLTLVVGAHVENNEFSIDELKTLVEMGKVKENMGLAKQRILAHPYFCADGTRKKEDDILSNKIIFYPGAFNPPHKGHFQGAEAAINAFNAKRINDIWSNPYFHTLTSKGDAIESTERTVVFSTTINPPHKNPLTPAEMLQRACMMKGHNFLLTEGDALYVDKAKRFPDAHFIVGADALRRMLDVRWGVDCKTLLNEFTQKSTRFWVLGRLVDNQYMTGQDVLREHRNISGELMSYQYAWEDLIRSVDFRLDISSSELRGK